MESLALSILRIIEEEALKENTGRVQAQLPVEVATFLLNEKRQPISEVEQRHNIDVVLIPNKHLDTPTTVSSASVARICPTTVSPATT